PFRSATLTSVLELPPSTPTTTAVTGQPSSGTSDSARSRGRPAARRDPIGGSMGGPTAPSPRERALLSLLHQERALRRQRHQRSGRALARECRRRALSLCCRR